MKSIATMLATVVAAAGLTLAIPASASASGASAGKPRPWTSLCGAATGALCAQASRLDRTALAEPYSTTSYRQADNWAGASSITCGPPNAPGIVYAAPYWCPFTRHALDTAMSGLPVGSQFVGMDKCAGARKVSGRWVAPLMTCFASAALLVRIPGTGQTASFVNVVASDSARQPMWLTLPGKAGQSLAWRPAVPGSPPGWVYVCPATSCYP